MCAYMVLCDGLAPHPGCIRAARTESAVTQIKRILKVHEWLIPDLQNTPSRICKQCWLYPSWRTEMRLTEAVSMLQHHFHPPFWGRVPRTRSLVSVEKGINPVSQVACTSGNELVLPLSMTMEGIGRNLGSCLMLGLEHILKPTLLSLGKKPCRTPATTMSGRSAERDTKTGEKLHLRFVFVFFLNWIYPQQYAT